MLFFPSFLLTQAACCRDPELRGVKISMLPASLLISESHLNTETLSKYYYHFSACFLIFNPAGLQYNDTLTATVTSALNPFTSLFIPSCRFLAPLAVKVLICAFNPRACFKSWSQSGGLSLEYDPVIGPKTKLPSCLLYPNGFYIILK